ncbi:hypothetical protein ACSYDW_12755 [Paeniglutamicibacter sp. R2-26]|uniref:hypothetical protein n=1 Tax=Paeniglutamicibacter sp. R2-26 TaxID=3144417 RepID=UPI003EE6EB7D
MDSNTWFDFPRLIAGSGIHIPAGRGELCEASRFNGFQGCDLDLFMFCKSHFNGAASL